MQPVMFTPYQSIGPEGRLNYQDTTIILHGRDVVDLDKGYDNTSVSMMLCLPLERNVMVHFTKEEALEFAGAFKALAESTTVIPREESP